MKLQKWQDILKTNITRWEDLAQRLELSPAQIAQINPRPAFLLNVPLRLVQKMQKGKLDDPLLQQFLPSIAEQTVSAHFHKDPVGDLFCRKSSKLLHKYAHRVLLICTSACAMHCRYCFRQHFDYAVKVTGFEDELTYIEQNPTIHEVILSGGDPLSLPDRHWQALIERFNQISHLKRLRIHTRFPVGIPERLDVSFLEILKKSKLQLCFVLHINHVNETDTDFFQALRPLRQMGALLLNQSVLLKGINDDIQTLFNLYDTLINQGIIPYYLHQLDRVQGAEHFEVCEEKGKSLIRELAKRLPGYAVPKYVREISGELSKTAIF